MTKKCKHKNQVKKFVGYFFTLEKFAIYCEDCGKKLSKIEYK